MAKSYSSFMPSFYILQCSTILTKLLGNPARMGLRCASISQIIYRCIPRQSASIRTRTAHLLQKITGSFRGMLSSQRKQGKFCWKVIF